MNTLYLSTIKTLVKRFPAVVPYLTRNTRIIAAVKMDLSRINKKYHDAITRALVAYFEGGAIGPSRNAFKDAMITAFGDAFDAGYVDGGGELPIDDDALAWVEGRLNEEAAFIDGVFQEAKDLRRDKNFDFFSWATSRADGYTATLAYIYNTAKLMANSKQMLTWNLGQTEKHCDTCLKLNGQRHKASWYISKNYIPRQPDAAMDCKGYNCDCSLTNDKGEEVTI